MTGFKTPDLSRAGLLGVAAAIRRHGWPDAAATPLVELELLPPLPDPGRIFGIASNYRAGLTELGRPSPGRM